MKFTRKEVDKLRKLLDEKGMLEMQKYMLSLVQKKSRPTKRAPDLSAGDARPLGGLSCPERLKMITWEEIRDIIEEEVYIGSGTVLGVSDAARAIVARIEEAAQQSVQRTACAHADLSRDGKYCYDCCTLVA